ncbi:hypothetical protein D3C85_1797610 [compost metagenome]
MAGGPLQQLGPQLVFQPLHPVGDGRLGQVQLAGGVAEAALPHDPEKGFQLGKFEAGEGRMVG